jgi:hypothetical protein
MSRIPDISTGERRTVLAKALEIVKAERKRHADWAESAEEWRRQGYRPHYCPHGMNLWVDYDVICGACEDGRGYFDYLTELDVALCYVGGLMREVLRRRRALGDLMTIDAHVPITGDLYRWTYAPLKDGRF